MPRPSRKESRQKQFLELYVKLQGNISAITGVMGITRKTVYDWINKDPEFKAKVDEIPIDDLKLDIAEHQLNALIKEKNFPAIKFFLESKGKSRGYGNEVKVTINDSEQTRKDVMQILKDKHKKKG